jgi:hypothetical protein
VPGDGGDRSPEGFDREKVRTALKEIGYEAIFPARSVATSRLSEEARRS